MKSIRLSKTTRSQILESIVSEFEKTQLGCSLEMFEKRRAEVKTDAMRATWYFVYGDSLKSLLDKLPESHKQNFHFGVSGPDLYLTEHLDGLPGKVTAGVDVALNEEQTERFFGEYLKLRTKLKLYEDEVKQFRNEVQAVLDSVNTTAQLIELWPSVEKYIPAHVADPDKGVNLPALNISRLDERLGKV